MDWNRTVSEIGPRLYRYFCASFAPEMASDLTQETLIRTVRKYDEGSFDPAQGTLLMLAYGIARNVRFEAWRSTPPEDSWADPKDFDHRIINPTEESLVEIQIAQLRTAIADLNEIQQQVVLLHIDQELTLQEIGTMLGLPLNTVKSHVHRAKELLKVKLCSSEGVNHE